MYIIKKYQKKYQKKKKYILKNKLFKLPTDIMMLSQNDSEKFRHYYQNCENYRDIRRIYYHVVLVMNY